MNIWITGSGGFLGTRLMRAFTAGGYQVLGMSRGIYQPDGQSVSIDLASEESPGQLNELGENFGYPDVVVHTAARIDKEFSSYRKFIEDNVLSTANLLEGLSRFPPRQIIYTSSLTVYKEPETIPVKESHPIRVNYPYSLTKLWGEQLIEAFQCQSQAIVLRLPNLYGAGQLDSFIDGLARLAMENQEIELFGRGKRVRDTVHVEDVVDAILSCVTGPPQGRFCCMNIGCGERITTREYVEALVQALDSTSKIIPVDRPAPHEFDFYLDIGEARRQIGFKPTPLITSMGKYAAELRAGRP